MRAWWRGRSGAGTRSGSPSPGASPASATSWACSSRSRSSRSWPGSSSTPWASGSSLVAAALGGTCAGDPLDPATLGRLWVLIASGGWAVLMEVAIGFGVAFAARSPVAGIAAVVGLFFAERFAEMFVPGRPVALRADHGRREPRDDGRQGGPRWWPRRAARGDHDLSRSWPSGWLRSPPVGPRSPSVKVRAGGQQPSDRTWPRRIIHGAHNATWDQRRCHTMKWLIRRPIVGPVPWTRQGYRKPITAPHDVRDRPAVPKTEPAVPCQRCRWSLTFGS